MDRTKTVCIFYCVGLIFVFLYLDLCSEARSPNFQNVKNSRLRQELLEMAASDRAVRQTLMEEGVEQPNDSLVAEMMFIDSLNTTRLRQIISMHGWPDLKLVGRDGVEAAFLIVQHAGHDFRKEMLPMIQQAVISGELAGQDYALLVDRIRIDEGRPQLYGTQLVIVDGKLVLNPIEDESHVDERRTSLGMIPLKEYLKLVEEMYGTNKDSLEKNE